MRAPTGVRSCAAAGPDIPPNAVERLFQPFGRLDADRTGDGLGLGLSIVQAIAHAHDATIAAQPCAHGGLEVQISFPSAQPQESGSSAAQLDATFAAQRLDTAESTTRASS
jgi:K+-sensing histidine kinase KdpD